MTRPVPAELTGAVDQLVHEFAGVFAREAVQDCVLDSYERLRPGARITTYLPLLAYRFAPERLRSLESLLAGSWASGFAAPGRAARGHWG